MRRCHLGLLAVGLLAAPCPAADPAPAFPLKDGDVWVMAGDSITAQHLHSNYFEAFCHARYPKLTFAFRNSGVGGHTIPTTLARFDYDVAAWKPTVVSVELGMNDVPQTTAKRSVSLYGLSDVVLTFKDGTDNYFARQQVFNRMGDLGLPDGVTPSISPLSAPSGLIYRYVLQSPDRSPMELKTLEDWTVAPQT